MNQTEILRLETRIDREQYIRAELNGMKRPALIHIISEYGYSGRDMDRETAIDVITDALLNWAERENGKSFYSSSN